MLALAASFVIRRADK